MENEADEFHVKQFRRIGMSEAYDDEMKKQMTQGVPEIFVRMHKAYDGDKVEADIYLKKIPDHDTYEIKKFELSLQKEGQENKISQTFYIGGLKQIHNDDGNVAYRQNRYTLKEGYNLLSGRPVHKELVNKDGAPYDAWVKLDFKNKLPNGNYETNFFTKNYGYNLEKVLKEYPVKELTNPKYAESLTESLRRGNLQSATFMQKDGSEEKLFISPNIKMGSLNVYDENKKLIPTEQLAERNLISKELGERLSFQEEKLLQKQDITKEHKQHQKIS